MQPLRWALVGSSTYATQSVAPALATAAHSSLAAVVSRDAARAAALAEELGAESHATSIGQLDPERVDAVFVVTPNVTHADLTVEAAQAGFHVVVEKPMAPTLAECDRMMAAAEQHGVRLAVAHCMAWTSPVVAARRLVLEGAIGKVLGMSIGIGFPNAPDGSWRQQDPTAGGGGPLYDLGSHALDVVHRILGVPKLVSGLLDRTVHPYPAHDTASALLRHADGAHTALRTSFAALLNSFEVTGTEGRLISGAWLGREMTGDLHLVAEGRAPQPVVLEPTNVYVEQAAHLSHAFLSGEPSQIDAGNGRDVVAVIAAAVRAAETGTAQPVPGVGSVS